jgi:hypothetical protein
MIWHNILKRLYSDDRWMRYITKKSVRMLEAEKASPKIQTQATIPKPPPPARLVKNPHEEIKRMQKLIGVPVTGRLGSIPKETLGKFSGIRSEDKRTSRSVEVLYCMHCQDHYLKRDLVYHSHHVPLSKGHGPRISG